jgi:hypothetical protein
VGGPQWLTSCVPAARAALWRWREVLAGAALACVALIAALATFGVTRWVAAAGVAVGLLLVVTGLQRLRFGAGGGGGASCGWTSGA